MSFSLQDYDILEEIGRGSFGMVLRARQKSLGKLVAIKCLMPQRAQEKNDILYFQREAQAMASLTHDSIISVLDYAFFNGSYYIVMEFIDGLTFEKALSDGIPLEASLLVLTRIAQALSCAHEHHVVHRDIKPANILLGRQGQIKLADFGLAAFQQDISQRSSMIHPVGTFSYMAPEAMASPKEADERVDIFSFGCILYQVLSGKPPFPGASIGEVSFKILNEAPPDLQVTDDLKQLAQLALRCLGKDRDSRPPIKEIISVLAGTIGDLHSAQEKLTEFIQSRQSPGVSGSSIKPRVATGKASKIMMSRATISVVVVIGAAVIVLAIFLAGQMRPRTRLPRLSELHNQLYQQETPVFTTKDSAEGAEAEAEVGTLILKGVGDSDKFFINGKRVPLPMGQNQVGIPVLKGRNQLEIRSDGKKFRKEIIVVPSQVVTWEPRQEKSSNGQ
jgi:serine/threonine protein kinase